MQSILKRKFTLIELLVVIAIVVILAAMLLPVLNKARERSKTIKCVSNRKQIGTIMAMYFEQSDDYAPLGRWGAAGANERWYRSIYDANLYHSARLDRYLGCPGKANIRAFPTADNTLAYNWRLGQEGISHPKVIKAKQPSRKFVIGDCDSEYYMHEGNYRVSKNYNAAMPSTAGFFPQHNDQKSGTMLYLDGHTDQLFMVNRDISAAAGWWYVDNNNY